MANNLVELQRGKKVNICYEVNEKSSKIILAPHNEEIRCVKYLKKKSITQK